VESLSSVESYTDMDALLSSALSRLTYHKEELIIPVLPFHCSQSSTNDIKKKKDATTNRVCSKHTLKQIPGQHLLDATVRVTQISPDRCAERVRVSYRQFYILIHDGK
jgi:hypothetical protein